MEMGEKGEELGGDIIKKIYSMKKNFQYKKNRKKNKRLPKRFV